ncbi:hypothetical protein ACEPAF_1996 [Sanghuangporus sanghuang]
MSIIGGIDLTGGTIAAFGTLLVYDVFFVTFDREVALVWTARWNLGKVLFFLNRYLPFFDTFLSLHLLLGKNTDKGCLLGFSAVTWLIVVGIIVAEAILMLRTYAIWERKRSIFITLILLGCGTFIPGIIVTQFEVESLAYVANPNGGCTKTKPSSPVIFVAFLLLILCETTIVILTLVRARHHYLSRQTRSPLIWQLYKDGLLYYVYLLAFSLVNLITAVAAPPAYTNWLTTPQRVMHSLLCTRVLLHIRSHNTDADSENMSTQVAMSFTPYYDQGRTGMTHSSATASGSGSGSGSDADTRLFLTFSSHTESTSPSEPRSSVFRYKELALASPGVESSVIETPRSPRIAEEIELQPLSRPSEPQVRFTGPLEGIPEPRSPTKGKDRQGS